MLDRETGAVAIIGGGPAGMAMALALHRQGVAAEIHDARDRAAAATDARILALSHGSRQILQWLGAWDGIPATPIETIHVSQSRGLGITRIEAGEQGVLALGYVLAAGALAERLDRALARAGIIFHERSAVTAANRPAAALTIWAEGAVDAGVGFGRDYGQHAVLCTASVAGAPPATAWERFTPQGPVAVLPYGRELAVVLTCPSAAATGIAALDDAAFLALLQERFGARLRFRSVGPRHLYPLGLRFRPQPVAERQAWIGNAAQTLHPVAGQGFNLALRDIYELADSVRDAADPGAAPVLRAYAARRRVDRFATMAFTDTLVRLFSNDNFLLHRARDIGLIGLELLPPLRSFLARRMIYGTRSA